jgi:RNA recognition motif-containing protein
VSAAAEQRRTAPSTAAASKHPVHGTVEHPPSRRPPPRPLSFHACRLWAGGLSYSTTDGAWRAGSARAPRRLLADAARRRGSSALTSLHPHLPTHYVLFADGLRAAMERFGPVAEATVMRESSGRSRGFAYVRFKAKAASDAALKEGSITLDGRRVRRDALPVARGVLLGGG